MNLISNPGIPGIFFVIIFDLSIEKDIRYKTKHNNLMNTEDKQKIDEHIKEIYVRRKKITRTFVQVGGVYLAIGVILLIANYFFAVFSKMTVLDLFEGFIVLAIFMVIVLAGTWFARVDISEERKKLTKKRIKNIEEIDVYKSLVEKSGAFIARNEKFLENKDAMEYFLSQDQWVIDIWHKIDKLERKNVKLTIELKFLGGLS